MVAIPDSQDDHANDDHTNDLERMNDMLAEWAARSATTSAALIDRFEAMGYEVRGKAEDEIAEILHRSPTRAVRAPASR